MQQQLEAAFEAPADFFIQASRDPIGAVLPIVQNALACSSTYYGIARDSVEDALNAAVPQFLPAVDAFVDANSSPLSAKLPLMDIRDVIVICLGYLATIASLTVLSKVVFRRKLDINGFATLHNLVLTSLSFYMFAEVLRQAIVIRKFNIFGNPVDHTEAGWGLAKIIWVFYVSKILEFLDTVIMILKQNFRQVSFLHVYHHLSIFAVWWLVVMMAPGGDSYYSAALNSFIHVLMYGYYFLAAQGVSLNFIKKRITQMQMLQFVTMLGQASFVWYTNTPGYPVLLAQILFFYMISMLALFFNFYSRDRARDAAAKKAKIAAETKQAENATQDPKQAENATQDPKQAENATQDPKQAENATQNTKKTENATPNTKNATQGKK